ncbi:hypothetical protein [Zavarzinella formosa]|uniref:hypothetical protein n=1 Tax=Zavarzinella formosa TaxID=360055 RepID=UPI0002D4C0C2|nr:hypothetical protein [Zavarzinella formosa]
MTFSRFAWLAFPVALFSGAVQAQDSLDLAFREAAPKILAKLKADGDTSAGVLKFMVKVGDKPASDMVGELNMSLADRLEAALILASDSEKFGFVRRASLTVVGNQDPRASHLTVSGRMAFFDEKYPHAWKAEKIVPSSFVTGLALLDPKTRKMKLEFQVFRKDGEIHPLLEPLDVALSRRTMVEAGFSYALTAENSPKLFGEIRERGTKAKGAVKLKEEEEIVVRADEIANQGERPKPGSLSAEPTAETALNLSPVKWRILYDDKPQTIVAGSVPEPTASQTVKFEIENTDPKTTHAVVLKVNGINTLFSQEIDSDQCSKWVLAPNTKVTIAGFQREGSLADPFKVLPPEESKAEFVRYGPLAGTFRMTVFTGEEAAADPYAADKLEYRKQPEYLTSVAIARGVSNGVTRQNPGSLKRLQANLLDVFEESGKLDPTGARGLVVKGTDPTASPVNAVFFKPTPTVPTADITVRYYQPK